MTPEQFCYWLQGRAELVEKTPSDEEWEVIREHLGLVFNKVTRKRVNPEDLFSKMDEVKKEQAPSDVSPTIPFPRLYPGYPHPPYLGYDPRWPRTEIIC
jgi:hypothetical protein